MGSAGLFRTGGRSVGWGPTFKQSVTRQVMHDVVPHADGGDLTTEECRVLSLLVGSALLYRHLGMHI